MPILPAVSRVLLMERDDATRESVTTWLRAEGYEVVAAPDVATGLALSGPPGHWRPHLVLLGVEAPDADQQFVDEYRGLPGPHAPVILVGPGATAERAARLSASGVLRNPRALADLIRLVERAIRSAEVYDHGAARAP